MSPRPWPVVLLSALGAWLAAIPFFGVAVLLMEPLLREQEGALVTGVLMLGGALALLRAPTRSLFIENLGVPAMLAGLTLLGWGLMKPLDWQPMCAAIGLVMLALASAVPQAWVRSLLGAMSAQCFLLACSMDAWWPGDRSALSPWLALHLLVAVWLASVALSRESPATGTPPVRAINDIGNGWVASTLLAMAWWSGSTFMLSEPLKVEGVRAAHGMQASWMLHGIDLGSLGAALLGMFLLAWRWPNWRQLWCAGLATVACALAAFMPALGGVLLVASTCLVTRRPRMAVWAGLVALWVIGAFYYQLTWPLATKALVLVVAGVLTGGLAALGKRSNATETTSANHPTGRAHNTLGRGWALGLGLLATLLLANGAIWQNETLIRDGRPVYVSLAPVDPRSLLQGDYMALRFDTDRVVLPPPADPSPVYLVFKVDARGVASAVRQHRGEQLQADELIMRMARQRGGWMLVTDAFHFKEGEAQRWAGARFGEFRVQASGRALLVGLRGAALEPL